MSNDIQIDLPRIDAQGNLIEHYSLDKAAELLGISVKQLKRNRVAVENIVGRKLAKRLNRNDPSLSIHYNDLLLIVDYRQTGEAHFAQRHGHNGYESRVSNQSYQVFEDAEDEGVNCYEAEVIEVEDVVIEVEQADEIPELSIVPVAAGLVRRTSYSNKIDEMIALMAVNNDQQQINEQAERVEELRQIYEDEQIRVLQEIETKNRARADLQAKLRAATEAAQKATQSPKPQRGRRK